MNIRAGVAAALLLLVIFAGTAAAGDGDEGDFEHTSYDDTGEISFGELDLLSLLLTLLEPDPDGEDATGAESVPAPVVSNGDFSQWHNGAPQGWGFWSNGPRAGWEQPHLANVSLTSGGDGSNPGLGLFVRNVGGDGSFFVGAYQPLNVQAAGNYWVTIHSSMFGQFNSAEVANLYFVEHPFNAMAWYGIGASAAPESVSHWRELYPAGDLPGFTPCPNQWGACIYGARYETVSIEPGQYLHLKAGHKFPVFNDWTTFVFDDIAIVPADGGEAPQDGFVADGVLFWEEEAAR